MDPFFPRPPYFLLMAVLFFDERALSGKKSVKGCQREGRGAIRELPWCKHCRDLHHRFCRTVWDRTGGRTTRQQLANLYNHNWLVVSLESVKQWHLYTAICIRSQNTRHWFVSGRDSAGCPLSPTWGPLCHHETPAANTRTRLPWLQLREMCVIILQPELFVTKPIITDSIGTLYNTTIKNVFCKWASANKCKCKVPRAPLCRVIHYFLASEAKFVLCRYKCVGIRVICTLRLTCHQALCLDIRSEGGEELRASSPFSILLMLH